MVEKKNKRPWRSGVGGLWKKIGKLQFDFLVKEGLNLEHFLLDVGCGSLRGGIYFVKYLKERHYFGIDKNSQFLEGGKIELYENDLINKKPVLRLMENFDFVPLNQTFDYVLAQSVFTHLEDDKIKLCLKNIEKILVQDGKFYATFFESCLDHNNEPITHHVIDGKLTTYSDKDTYHYPFSFFQKLCDGTSLVVRYIGEWNHPRDQQIMVFYKK